MSDFKWYRRLRGGYWVYQGFAGWNKIDFELYNFHLINRKEFIGNKFLECYE